MSSCLELLFTPSLALRIGHECVWIAVKQGDSGWVVVTFVCFVRTFHAPEFRGDNHNLPPALIDVITFWL